MAKRSNNSLAPLEKKAREQEPPRLSWREQDDQFTPIVTLANLVIPLDPRPFKGFYKGERDAILVWVKQALSEVLFGTPMLLVHPKTSKSARNPDWDLMPYFEKHETEVGAFVEVTPRPSDLQEDAGNRLSVE